MSQRKLGTILSYLNIFLSNTISLIYTPYMLRMLGQSEYGIYGTAQSFISYLSILSFGIGGAYIRYNAKYRVKNDKEGEKKLNGMFLVIFSILALLVFVVGSILVFAVGGLVRNTYTSTELFKLRVVMMLLVINMCVTFIFNVAMMALNAYEKFIFIRAVLLINTIITPIINVIALRNNGKSITITAITLCLSILSYLCFYVYAKNEINLEFTFKGFDKEVMIDLFIFSSYLFVNSITDQITFSTDSIVLSAVHGTKAVAIYTVGANFRGYFQSFSGSVSSVFAPQVNTMIASKMDLEDVNDLFIRISRVQFYIVSLILIGYTFVGKPFIMLWAGSNYADAYLIGLLLILSVFVPAFQNLGVEIQKALNKHKARSVVYFFVALINILLTIVLAREYSGIGAAYATLICMFAGNVIFMNLYYNFGIGLNMIRYWKSILSILPGFILPAFAGFMYCNIFRITNLLSVLFAAVFITLVFVLSIWFFSMNEYEKQLIKKPIKKIFKRA